MKQTILGLVSALFLVSSSSAMAHPRPASGPYTLEVVNEDGHTLRTYNHKGRTYVLGKNGHRYLLRIRNNSSRRIEVVASVDGRDVVDGQPAATSKRGYIIDPHGQVLIDGFRTSQDTVAAFRFSKVGKSYAALMGNARDVGVIGVAVFSERYVPPPPPMPLPYHADKRASAPAPEAPSAQSRAESSGRSGLGTEFGEEHTSHVTQVEFVRASTAPDTVMSLRYNDRAGLIALGIDVDGSRVSQNELWMRETAEPFRTYARPPPGWNR